MFRGPHIEEKMAVRAAVLRRRLSRATYVVKYDYISSFYGFIYYIFAQTAKKNFNISIKILINYVFVRDTGRIDTLGGPRV